MAVQTKRCSKCKVEQDFDFFVRDKTRKDGRYPTCKSCTLRYARANKDMLNQGIRRRRKQAKEEVLSHYGAYCQCCGTTYVLHLTLDHVDGGGRQERKENSGSLTWYLARREGFPARFQVMCFNCNWAKYAEGQCRCQEDR